MSNGDKNDKSDITRIEDLSEFLHDEDDSFEGEHSFEGFDDSELMDAKTDPNIELPEEFQQNLDAQALLPEENQEEIQEEPDFGDLENEDSFTSSDFSEASDFSEESEFSEEPELPEEPEFSEDTESSDDVFQSDTFQDDDFQSDDFESDNFQEEEFNEDFPEIPSSQLEEEPEESIALEDVPEEIPEEIPKDIQEELQEESLDSSYENRDEKTPIETPLDSPVESLIDSQTNKSSYTPPENFQELQKFAKNISYGNLATEGSPPFSIILRDIKYQEDIQDILILLKEFQIIKSQEEEDSAQRSLERGTMLIPRLGEYSAITICHKLRRFDINILMGLTEEINPPKNYVSDDSGIVSKYSVYNSRSHYFDLEKDELSPSEILMSTTPYLEGHDIIDYIGIASESAMIKSKLLEASGMLEDELISRLPNYQQEKQRILQIERSNQSAARSIRFSENQIEDQPNEKPGKIELKDIHNSLVEKLKSQVIAQKGNALIGLNFHVTPLSSASLGLEKESESHYQVTCSGSIVWINKR